MTATNRKHTRMAWVLALLAVGMFGFGFALVPLYNSLCRTLGINGKVTRAEQVSPFNPVVDNNREITVEFVATNNSGVPWAFYPLVKKIVVHPGAITKLAFFAENTTDHRMIVQAIPSITPGIAAKYLKKTECFCFTKQSLKGHAAMNMPLLFHLDPDLPKNINTITLAYTLFDVTDRN